MVTDVSEKDSTNVSTPELESLCAEFANDYAADLDVMPISEERETQEIVAPPVGSAAKVLQTVHDIKKSSHHDFPYNGHITAPPDIQRCTSCFAILNNYTAVTPLPVVDSKENFKGIMPLLPIPRLNEVISNHNLKQLQLDGKVASSSNQGLVSHDNVPALRDKIANPEKQRSSNSSIKTLDRTPDRSVQTYNSSSTLSTNEARLVTPDNLACEKPRRRVRRNLEPQIKEYVEVKNIKSKDVLFGRGVSVGGVPVHDHPGNKKFREEIKKREQRYKKLLQPDKTPFSNEVVQWLKDHGGRFLKFDKDVGKWYFASDDMACEKVKAALREKHSPEAIQAKKEKKAKSRKAKKDNNIAYIGGIAIAAV